MSGLKWHLEIINWNDIKEKKFGGDIFCNTSVENFFTLDQVWAFIGHKLKKQRNGYAGIINNIEYRLTRYTFY